MKARDIYIMKKLILLTLAALAANVQTTSAQETGTIAPKPAYFCDFEQPILPTKLLPLMENAGDYTTHVLQILL